MCNKKRRRWFHRRRPQRTTLILTFFINNYQIKIQTMQLETQQFVDSILGLVDHDTQEAIPATFANIVLTSSDPAIFTADTDVNADGTIDVVGVSEGNATLNVKADVTYTDKNTGKEVTKAKEANVPVTVTLPPPSEENTDLVVTFSTPQPVTPAG